MLSEATLAVINLANHYMAKKKKSNKKKSNKTKSKKNRRVASLVSQKKSNLLAFNVSHKTKQDSVKIVEPYLPYVKRFLN